MTGPSTAAVLEAELDGPIDLAGFELEQVLDLYYRLVLVRAFEDRVNKLFLQGRIPGTIHLSHGQEACAVGGTAPLRQDDWITVTHRGHGQALAKGVSARSLMAELFARDTGCCRGQGGSLHVGDIAVGVVPGIAIVGAAVPITAGIAFAFRHRREDRIALCFLGDGAFCEGDTHEGLNLAALWELPVVYLCENNRYSISTPIERQTRVTSLAGFAGEYGMATATVDGNNVLAVYRAVDEAATRARAGGGPSFVECLTYRQGGHKRDDPGTYRPAEEVARWLARDPIKRLRAALVAAGAEASVEQKEQEAIRGIDDAVDFAEHSPPAQAVVAR